MINEEQVIDAVSQLKNNCKFEIGYLKLDETDFGNLCIVLNNKLISIRYIRDRGDYWCEIGKDDEWYFLEDVLAFVGEADILEKYNILDYVKITSETVNSRIGTIERIFKSENYDDTKKKLKRIAQERVKKIFK